MIQADQLECALDELEKVRAKQDVELEASFAAFADLGAAMLEVDVNHLQRLSECFASSAFVANARQHRLVTALGRC